ncbi:5'-methylthioadenosine/adenosylhomocysteine nucleosidase [Fangia hongkongensis]|uniref:5'-methylthioadenosine/adenosylhomocysteine nucleosidase n=1 Tax=Fangia hongkongensis TaxID=270495 RepID=UPI0004779178|nr:5'-methylthioadenosine/adenosylhomocysteine nucleosidase [Fangia hongkongensis]MBK2125431.1 5'-methylthioadenosine/adenosylhomocysteine nucleosidase [Fangia hongkongensis]
MKIAILGAMEEEITPLLAKLKDYGQIQYANNTYYQAEYHGHTLIIAYSKIGKVFSALTASAMIQHFGAEVVLFSGVAGGVGEDIKIGDLVIATDTVQHDIDITAFGKAYGEIPGSTVSISTDHQLRDKAKAVASILSLDLKEGVIATGDQFIHNKAKKDTIQSRFKASAIEMEGGSVNLVCQQMNTPCLILRAISDTADGNATEDFPAFVEMAAKRSAEFILSIIKSL